MASVLPEVAAAIDRMIEYCEHDLHRHYCQCYPEDRGEHVYLAIKAIADWRRREKFADMIAEMEDSIVGSFASKVETIAGRCFEWVISDHTAGSVDYMRASYRLDGKPATFDEFYDARWAAQQAERMVKDDPD